MAQDVTSPYKSGTVDSVSNNVITIGTGSDTPTAADISRSTDSDSTSPRILMITSGAAAGQYRKIIGQTSTTYTLDYPFDISAYRGEFYQDENSTRVSEVNPSNGDSYVLSSTLEEIYDADTDNTWNTTVYEEGSYYEKLDSGGDLQIGNSTNSVVLFDENVTFKTNMSEFNVFNRTGEGSSSVVRGAMVLGYTNPGFDTIDHYLSSTNVTPTPGQLVYQNGNLYKCISTPAAAINVNSDLDTNTAFSDEINTTNGFPEQGCKLIDNGGTTGQVDSTEHGDIHLNGCLIEVIPDVTNIDDIDNGGPWTDLPGNGTFWRIWRHNNQNNPIAAGDDVICRFWKCSFYGPIGARIQGEKSIILDNTFSGGGNALGCFNPVNTDDSYFGLIKGNSFVGKTQGLYVWYSAGANVIVDNPTFSNIKSYLIYINNSDESATDSVTLSNFDTRQLTEFSAFGNSTADFIFRKSGGIANASAIIAQDVTIGVRDTSLDLETGDTFKLAWTDSQDNDATTLTTTTGQFATERIEKWRRSTVSGTINYSDGTDFGPFDFGLYSYDFNNQTFQDDLEFTVEQDRIVTADDRVTSTNALDINYMASTDNAYDVMKLHKYNNPYDGGVENVLIMDKVSDTLEFNTGTVSARDITFTTSGSNAFTFAASELTFRLENASDNINVNIDLGNSNDVNVGAFTIASNIECQNFTNSYGDDDTIADGDVKIKGAMALTAGNTYVLDGGVDVTEMTFTKTGTGDNPIITLADAVTDDGTNETTFTNVTAQIQATVEVTGPATYDSSLENTQFYSETDGVYTIIPESDITYQAFSGGYSYEVLFPNGHTLHIATVYDGYKPQYTSNSAGGTVAIDLNDNNGLYTSLEWVSHTLDTDEETFSDSATFASDSSGITITTAATAISVDENGCKQIMQNWIGSNGYVRAMAQQHIDADLIIFDTAGFTCNDTDALSIEKTTDSSTIVRMNIEAVDGGSSDASGNVTSGVAANEIRFLSPSQKVSIGNAQLAFVRGELEGELDERDMTKTNQERLGKLQPIEVS